MIDLEVRYEGFDYGGINVGFYFDGVKVQEFWFSLLMDKFYSMTRFLERILNKNDLENYPRKDFLKDNQWITNRSVVDLDGEGIDLYLTIEEICTRKEIGPKSAKFDCDTVHLTISGLTKAKAPHKKHIEYFEATNSITGDKKQIIGELYFSMMNVLGSELAKNENDEYHEQNSIQDYNDCKSLKIEEFLYPELKDYYTDKASGIHQKSQIIRAARIVKASQMNLDEVFALRNETPKDVEIFYQIGDDEINSLRMILPSETLKAQIAANSLLCASTKYI